MRHRILMLVATLALAAASSFPAAAVAPQCNCTYCRQQPSAFCDIRFFHTSCAAYYPNFCVEE